MTEQSETSSSKQTVIEYLALGIDNLGIQSLEALVTQLGVITGSWPLNREKPSALAEGVFTIMRLCILCPYMRPLDLALQSWGQLIKQISAFFEWLLQELLLQVIGNGGGNHSLRLFTSRGSYFPHEFVKMMQVPSDISNDEWDKYMGDAMNCTTVLARKDSKS